MGVSELLGIANKMAVRSRGGGGWGCKEGRGGRL